MLNYNDGGGTVDAIKRICGFSCFSDIIAVDNASTDDSAAYIEAYIKAAEKHSKAGLHFIRAPKNGGYGFGNNTGVRYAYEKLRAELVVIANPDAVFDEPLILSMSSVFDSCEDAAAVGAVMHRNHNKDSVQSDKLQSDVERSDMARPDNAQPGSKRESFSYAEYTASGWKDRDFLQSLINSGPVSRRIFNKMINYPRSHYNADIIPVYAVHGSLLMVKAADFLSVGGYDEHMFLYGEENVLAERLRLRGFASYLVSQGYEHEGSVSITGSGLKAAARQKLRNQSELYYYKHYLGAGWAGLAAAKLFQAVVLAETRLAALIGYVYFKEKNQKLI